MMSRARGWLRFPPVPRRLARIPRLSAAVAALALSPASYGIGAAPPDLRGVWLPVNAQPLLQTTEGKSPPLRPELRDRYARNIEAGKSGESSFDTTKSSCQPPGIPRVFSMTPFRILEKADFVMFVFEWNHLHVLVPILPRHTEDSGEVFFFGESIGRWDRDVLVVDTVRANDQTLLDAALPHSEALHVTSRFRLGANGNVLVADVSIDDPKTFTSRWTTRLEFHRAPADTELREDVCADRESIPISQDARVMIPSLLLPH